MTQTGLLFFAFVALIAWLVNLHFIKIRAWEKSPQKWIVRSSWLSTLCLALAMTFQVASAESGLQAHLLFWYLAYITISLAIYFSALSNAYHNYGRMRHWATVLLIGNLSILSYLYVFYISKITWMPDHHIPKNLPEWMYMITLFVYGAILGGVPIIEHIRDYSKETAIPTRTRYVALMIARIASTIYFLIKILRATVGYFSPTYGELDNLLIIHDIALGITGIFWIGMFLPNQFLMQVSTPFIFLSKYLAYGRLQKIPQYFSAFQTDLSPISVVNEPDSLWDLLANLNFYLYRTVIHILDIKKHLEGVFDEKKYLLWDAENLQKAQTLRTALEGVEDDRDYWLLIHDYSKVALQLRIKYIRGSVS